MRLFFPIWVKAFFCVFFFYLLAISPLTYLFLLFLRQLVIWYDLRLIWRAWLRWEEICFMARKFTSWSIEDYKWSLQVKNILFYAAVNGYLKLTLLRGRQRFDAISTSNLEEYNFWDRWIFTQFIFEHDESLPSKICLLNLLAGYVGLFM